MRAGHALILLGFSVVAFAHNHFRKIESIVGNDFFEKFTWETFDDPTHGRVNYVDQSTAKNRGYSSATEDKFWMSANSRDVVAPDSRGRDSVRIISHEAYDEFAVVLDLEHMPEGCATWPAFWTLSRAGPWPAGGEIDIIEGVNTNILNTASLHTSSNCMMPESRLQSGTPTSNNCDAAVNFNQGCGTTFSTPNSYGRDLNSNRGGWFVMRKTRDHGVTVWFWERDDPNVPDEVRYGMDDIWPSRMWGLPDADFPTDSGRCDYDQHFNAHQIIFDLTFCGDWAGSVYGSSGCPGSCQDLVDNNPRAFANAYWEINSLRIYAPA